MTIDSTNTSEMHYDFNDGNGLVPAHRHINLNGNLGGWVANTAYVEPTVYIGKNARVYGSAKICDDVEICHNARIHGNAAICDKVRISDRAQIYGNACIHNKARIYGDARIYGNAHIFNSVVVYNHASVLGNAYICGDTDILGNAYISENAIVSNSNEYICIGPIGSRRDFVTFIRYPTIYANTECFSCTLEEFINAVKKIHNDNEHMENYMRVVEFIKGMWV